MRVNPLYSQEKQLSVYGQLSGFRNKSLTNDLMIKSDIGLSLFNDFWISPFFGFSYLSAQQEDTTLENALPQPITLSTQNLNLQFSTLQTGIKIRLIEQDSNVWPIVQTTLQFGQAKATATQFILEEEPDLLRQEFRSETKESVIYPVFSLGIESTPFGSETVNLSVLLSYTILDVPEMADKIKTELPEDSGFTGDLSSIGLTLALKYTFLRKKEL
ncbi:hypothetical protein NBT05_08405 [Aquimarina sp. ERC-38]|uniref:hypothetical protein n=1 Tax=Aquimarina sp. ERC-38 TaxID=2949996 RepID=UPI0022465DAB|nr:hypothetical protein [Aquimarina sp. ERC-38]UZO82483.1 hypothetical protein NBT05_08405 [Aquimarina sp. ERC-38]